MKDIKLMEIVRKGRNVNWVTQMNVSDTISGVSKGEINSGYEHPIEYWAKLKCKLFNFLQKQLVLGLIIQNRCCKSKNVSECL